MSVNANSHPNLSVGVISFSDCNRMYYSVFVFGLVAVVVVVAAAAVVVVCVCYCWF